MGQLSAPDFISSSYVGDCQGFTTVPQVTIFYTKVGALVSLLIPVFTGVSNATSLSITGAPASIWTIGGISGRVVLARIQDNSVNTTNGSGAVEMDTTGALIFRRTGSTSGWTNVGDKGISGAAVMIYQIQNG